MNWKSIDELNYSQHINFVSDGMFNQISDVKYSNIKTSSSKFNIQLNKLKQLLSETRGRIESRESELARLVYTEFCSLLNNPDEELTEAHLDKLKCV